MLTLSVFFYILQDMCYIFHLNIENVNGLYHTLILME